MIHRLTRMFRSGLLPLLLAVGLLGGMATEAVACAGEPVIEHAASADHDPADTHDGEEAAGMDACQHGHSHHVYALASQAKGDTVHQCDSSARALPVTNLSSAPPGGLERPPRT